MSLRSIIRVSVILFLFWLIGLIWFISIIPDKLEDKDTVTNSIVVLTGGKNRLLTGFKLLEENKAEKLLISGVDEKANMADLKQIYNKYTSEEMKSYEDRITLGHYATNTYSNALETALWMKANKFKSLRLVTSNYHLPRSLIEFQSAMPDIKIIPHPVFTDNFELNKWWLFPMTVKLIMLEYNKYLFKKFMLIMSG